MSLTGTWPRKERMTPMPQEHPEGKFVALATNRHEFCKPIRAVTSDFQHLVSERSGSRFKRFKTREDGERWLYENRAKLDLAAYRYTVTDL